MSGNNIFNAVNTVTWNGKIFVAGGTGNGTNTIGWSYDGKTWYPSESGDTIFSNVYSICFKPLVSDRQEYEVYIENEDNVIVLDNNEKLSFNCEVYNNDVKDISIVCLVSVSYTHLTLPTKRIV